jgi:hypothetical protein
MWPVLAGSLSLAAVLASSAAVSGQKFEATPDAYRLARESKGVVLMAVDWSRVWGFCGAENVQLRTFAFDRMPVEKRGDDEAADLVIKAPSSLLAGPGTITHYALLLEPGEYALTSSELKVARSVGGVDNYRVGRNQAMQDGKPVAGSFTVAAGETVYVGHFGLDCVEREPTLWRYYIIGKAGFKNYLATRVTPKYPFLDTESIQYRLFKTSTIGNDYELQCYFPSSAEQADGDGAKLFDSEDCKPD